MKVSVPPSRGTNLVSTSTEVNPEQPGLCLVPFPHSQLAPHCPFLYVKQLLVGPHGKAAKWWSGLKRAHLWDNRDSRLQPDFGMMWPRRAFLKPSLLWKLMHNIHFHLYPALPSKEKSNQSWDRENLPSHHNGSTSIREAQMNQGTSHPVQMSKATRF